MSIYLLDGKDMTGKEAAYAVIAKELDFPDYFGKNLDALYDCLTEMNSDNAILFVNTAILEENLGDYAEKLRRVFKDVGNLPYACRFTEYLS